ncbi:MAG: transposase zinc-binding domain-containing protein [Candidatus Riflebacteria bacterium]|nr:transposase zinc-binding domain-containing protein [Candidatus Riflebacteria bacterium]
MSTHASHPAPETGGPAVYRPRQPQKTVLYQVVSQHYPELKEAWDSRFLDRYGPLRTVAQKTFDGYLACGLLERGFARIRCESCHEELLLAFSCKTRNLCPSCGKKRQLLFSQFVSGEVLEPVRHRQVVLTIPKRIRPFFTWNRKLLSKLARAGYLTLRKALRDVTDQPDGHPGCLACVQTFGALLDLNVHLHVLISWGTFDDTGTFHEASRCPDPVALQEDFRERVFRFLLAEGAIEPDVVFEHARLGAFRLRSEHWPVDRGVRQGGRWSRRPHEPPRVLHPRPDLAEEDRGGGRRQGPPQVRPLSSQT